VSTCSAKVKSIALEDENSVIYILGRRFCLGNSLEESNAELDDALLLLACFTYRSYWANPIPGTTLFSDAGWGCMVRVGQMVLFNTLARDQLAENSDFIEDRLKFLLLMFNDNLVDEIAPYSIHNIVPLAHTEFNIEMGSWFRSTSIMMCFDILNKKYSPKRSAHIEMLVLRDSVFYVDKIYERIFKKKPTEMSEQQMLADLYDKDWDCSLLLTLSTMIGLESPQKEFKVTFDFLTTLSQSVGVLGGEGNRAYYIFGLDQGKDIYYYLDPHLVQVENSNRRKQWT
jgi:cysteine protease ATG4